MFTSAPSRAGSVKLSNETVFLYTHCNTQNNFNCAWSSVHPLVLYLDLRDSFRLSNTWTMHLPPLHLPYYRKSSTPTISHTFYRHIHYNITNHKDKDFLNVHISLTSAFFTLYILLIPEIRHNLFIHISIHLYLENPKFLVHSKLSHNQGSESIYNFFPLHNSIPKINFSIACITTYWPKLLELIHYFHFFNLNQLHTCPCSSLSIKKSILYLKFTQYSSKSSLWYLTLPNSSNKAISSA